MRLDVVGWFVGFLAALLIAAVSAFLLFVPLMTIAAVSIIVLTSILIFALGVCAGRPEN